MNNVLSHCCLRAALFVVCALACAAQPLAFVDDYIGNLASSYTAGGTSLSVVSATGLPSGATQFYLVVRAETTHTKETFLVTNRSGTTLTVVGAQAGTSASNHASGATVAASIMTATAYRRMTDIFSSSKPAGTLGSEVHKNLTITNGSTSTILSTVSAAGYVSDVCVWSTKYSVAVTVTVDGEGTPSINAVNIADLLGDNYLDTQAAFSGRWITASSNGTNNPGGCFRLPIPFSSSVQIQLTNNSGSSAVITSYVVYHTGLENEWAYTQRLKVVVVSASGVAANAETNMVNVTPNKRGRLAGFGWIYDGFPGSASPLTAPLEGAFKIYLDGSGTAQYQTSGSEDMFGMGWYFLGFDTPGAANLNVLQNANPDVVYTVATAVGWGAQRFFIADPIEFNSALKIGWVCGNTSAVSFTGTCTLKSTVYYYVEN